jgi:hypothetical protein
MSDPRRWLESGADATPFEQALLAREAAAAPHAGLEGAVWQKILGALPPIDGGPPDTGAEGAGGDWGAGTAASGAGAGASGAGVGAGTTGAGVAGAGGAGLGVGASSALAGGAKAGGIGVAKALIVGAFAGAVTVVGTAELSQRVSPPETIPNESRTETSSESSRELPSRVQPAPSLVPAPTTAPTAARAPIRSGSPAEVAVPQGASSARFELPPGSGDSTSRTRAERVALERARGALRAGDPATALTWLDRAQNAASGGVLAQEREVLAIEALSAAGRRAEARSRAREFLARFPESPHTLHVRQFTR